MRILKIIAISLLITACAEQATDHVRVENAWIAEIPPVIKVTAALMVLHNDGDKPRYLIDASSPRAESIEVHKSIVVDDLARMIRQTEVEIPAHGSVEFSNETGYHLMFYGTGEIKGGQKILVSLKFKDGTILNAVYDVVDRRKRL